MNKTITSADQILVVSRHVAATQGLTAINMRSIAELCGVAVGSVYNYFPSKSALVAATVESIWREIMQGVVFNPQENNFLAVLDQWFNLAKAGTQHFPGFFADHTTGFTSEEKPSGHQTMDQYFIHVHQQLKQILLQDPLVKPEVFDQDFTPDALISLVVVNIRHALQTNAPNCNTLLHLIKTTIY